MKKNNLCVALIVIIFAVTLALSACVGQEVLSAPQIKLTKNVISWLAVESAEGYSVTVGANSYETDKLSYAIDVTVVGDYEVTVKSYKTVDGKKVYSQSSNKLVYSVKNNGDFSTQYDEGDEKMQSPVVYSDGNVVAWDVIHYATGYRIFVNGVATTEVVTNFFAVDTSTAGTYEITVKAFSSYEKYALSDASNAVSVVIDKAYTPIEVYVTDEPYKAVGDGKTNDREAIQKAIDDVAKAGGGKVVLSANKTFLTGNIFLKDNVTLEFEDGAMVKQSENPSDYVKPTDDGFVQYTPYFGTNINDDIQFNHAWLYNYPLISAIQGSKNVKVIGNGTVKLMDYGSEGKVMRMIAVGFGDVSYFQISDITITNYTAYATAAYMCNHGLFNQVKINGFQGGCNDGVSALNTSNLRITDCTIRSGDDSIDIGKSSDIRGGVWCPVFNQDANPVRNLEIDNNDNDAGSDACKGLAFFVWGGGRPDRAEAEVSDVYIHDNTFRTVGIWGSESHDSLYGGYGTVPAKNIRWYDNEIGLVQGGFYYSGISDMNYFQSMRAMMNGDFEYAGVGFWTTVGQAGVKEENGNHFGYIEAFSKGSAKIYEGLYLNAGEAYDFSAKVITSGATVRMFVKDLDTQEIVSSKEINNTELQTVTMTFTLPKDGNYQVGFESIDASDGWAKIDDVEVKAVYSDFVIFQGGSDTEYNVADGSDGEWIQGMNLAPSENSLLKANDIIKVVYFLDIKSVTDPNGSVQFAPLLQRGVDGAVLTVAESNLSVSYSALSSTSGKVALVFTIKLPAGFNGATDYIVPRLRLHSGISATFQRLMIVDQSMDLSVFSDRKVACELVADNGGFASTPQGVLYVGVPSGDGASINLVNGQTGQWLQGLNLAPSSLSSLKAGDQITVAYLFDVKNITDSNGVLVFSPLIQRVSSGSVATTFESSVTATYSQFAVKNGKVIVAFSMKLPDVFDGKLDFFVPRAYFNSGISANWDKVVITDGTVDLASLYGNYKMAANLTYGGQIIPPTIESSFFLDASSGAAITAAVGGDTGYMQGLNINPSAEGVLQGGQVIKVAYYINVDSITDPDGYVTFEPLLQRQSTGWGTSGYANMKIQYSDLAAKDGKIILSFVLQLPDDFDHSDDAIAPRIVFHSGINGTLDKVIISNGNYDFGHVSGYKLACEEVEAAGNLSVTNSWTASTFTKPTKLVAPVITNDGNNISWSAVENATGYRIYINNVIKETVTTNSYTFGETAEGIYSIKIKAVSSDNAYSTSISSNVLSLTVGNPIVKDSTVYFDAASGAAISAAIGGDTGYMQGLNMMPNPLGTLQAGKVIKFAYYVNISSITDPDGYVTFEPLLQRQSTGWGLSGSASMRINYSDLASREGNVVLAFVLQLPTGYDVTDDAIAPRIVFHSGFNGTLNKIVICGGDYDFNTVADYKVGCEEVNATGDMTVSANWTASTFTKPTKLVATVISNDSNTISWNAVENATGYRIYINNVIKETVTTISYTFSETAEGNYSIKVKAVSSNDAFATSDSSNVVTINVGAAVVKDTNVYYDAASGASITSAVGGDSGYIQGLNLNPNAEGTLQAGNVVKIAYYFTITEISDPNGYITFEPLIQRGSTGWGTAGSANIRVDYRDLAVTSGNVILSFVVQLPVGFNVADDAIVPRIVFHSGYSSILHKIIITGGDFDFGAVEGYKVACEVDSTSGDMAVTNIWTASAMIK